MHTHTHTHTHIHTHTHTHTTSSRYRRLASRYEEIGFESSFKCRRRFGVLDLEAAAVLKWKADENGPLLVEGFKEYKRGSEYT